MVLGRHPLGELHQPRLVNQICDYALVYAFTDGLDRIDAAVIEQVVTDRRTHGNLKMVV